jgi:3-deoxy-7-phosphoheptulonate synthase
MQNKAKPEEIDSVEKKLQDFGYKVFRSAGEMHVILGAIGTPKTSIDPRDLELMPGVRDVMQMVKPYKLVSRMFRPEGTIVDISGVRLGGNEIVIIAGPCAVESKEQMLAAAKAVRASGAKILRGGAFKPRTGPHSFQGLGEEGLRYLREAADQEGMPCVTEVMDPSEVAIVEEYADMLQVGARNMQNFRLLAAVGKAKKPVLLKRGLAATLEEFLMAAEYIAAGGNPNIVLCERGVRTFEPWTRNTLDLSAIPLLRKATHLPIIVDPSHATGIRDLVSPMARAGIAAGADGLIIEVHPDPDTARCDGAQSLNPQGFDDLVNELRIIAPAANRQLPSRKLQMRKKLDQPIFSKVVIFGVGLIGGSLALALKDSGAAGQVVGIDRPEAINEIQAANVVDQICPPDSQAAALKDADLVILASPILNIIESLGTIGKYLGADTIVTDVGGTKVAICEAAKKIGDNCIFIGGHPMAGSEHKGAKAADPLMFCDAVYALCKAEQVPEEAYTRLTKAIESIGALPMEIDPARHDRLTAAVSHVPHLVAVALTNSVGRLSKEDEIALRLAAGGFRDVTRTASSPYSIWQDTLATNKEQISKRLAALRESISNIEKMLDSDEQLESELAEAAAHRLNVPRSLPGLQQAGAELIVRVVDEPGALATILTNLAHAQINIRDIQVLKVRQDEDGVLRLAFESESDTNRAAEILRSAGHQVRVRRD